MHWAALHAYDKSCDPNKPDQLKQRSLPGQIDAIFRCINSTVRLSDNHHASWRERAAKFLDHARLKAICPARGQKDEEERTADAHRSAEVDRHLELSIEATRQPWRRRIPPALDNAQQDDCDDRPARRSRITRSLPATALLIPQTSFAPLIFAMRALPMSLEIERKIRSDRLCLL